MRIRTAIYGTYVIASAVGLAVLMRFVLAEVRPRYVSSLQRTMEESATWLAAVLEAQPESTWAETMARLPAVDSGLRVRVLIGSEVEFDSHQTLSETGAVAESRSAGVAKSVVTRVVDDAPYVTDGELQAWAGFERPGRPAGRVLVSRPLRSVNEFIWSERKKLALGAGLVALVMLGLGWWLARKLTGSLERLTHYAVAVSEGRTAELPVSRSREIAALAEAFEAMRRSLEGRDHVEHYTQGLAHELKSPLAAIRAAAELLQEPTMPAEDRARFLDHLQTESGRVQEIVDRMLRLAALEADAHLPASEAVDLPAVAAAALRAVAVEADETGVMVRLETEPAYPRDGDARTWQTRGDPFLLQQAIINLVQNAVAFSPAGGVVRVVLHRRAAEVEVVVEDEGPGLPAYALARAFDRFYSLPRPRGGRRSTGLGLSFVRTIMARHGGTAGLENRPEGGARAWLRLPVE